MIEHQVGFALAALAVVVLGSLVARRLRLPVPVVLVLAGLAYAVLPGRNVELDPDLVLAVIIPPLLYSAALESSLVDIRANLPADRARCRSGWCWPRRSLVGAVLAPVRAGAAVRRRLALGAAVAPPDPVAALAVGRRAGLPPRLITLIQGEGLLNDATALTIYQVAVAAATGAGFSMLHASGQFVLAALGGVAVGLAVAWVVRPLRRRAGRPAAGRRDLAGHAVRGLPARRALHVSGVLAVVVAGL